MRPLLITLLCLLTAPRWSAAQTPFQEGIIVYAVRIAPESNTAGISQQAGTYTLTVKNANVRKELRMNSGYQNVILQNRNTQMIYSLQKAGGQSYAIQLRPDDLKARQKPYEGFNMHDEDAVMTIAGQNCRKASVTYKDSSQIMIYYSIDWLSPDEYLFDRLPGIRNVPLHFEYKNEAGTSMYFDAEKIEARPVESSSFRVPPEYKIISNSEYKSLGK